MKLFSWMQNKLNGKQESKKPHPVPAASYPKKQEPREEFSDWPHGLLAIGTFGNNQELNNKDNVNSDHQSEIQNMDQEETSSSMDLQDFTPEEIGKFEKELTKLLRRKPTSSDNNNNNKVKEKEKEKSEPGSSGRLPLDRFLNCPSSLEVSRRISNVICCSETDINDHHNHNQNNNSKGDVVDDQDIKDEDIDRTISVILGRCKDIRADKSKKAIGKKSVSFLLKKMFGCRSGFAPQPSLRETFQESRMERFLRIMLHKKINSQNSRAPSMKKYLEDRQVPNKRANEDEKEKLEKNRNTNEGCKWVKTDSEYIVLEI